MSLTNKARDKLRRKIIDVILNEKSLVGNMGIITLLDEIKTAFLSEKIYRSIMEDLKQEGKDD